METAVYWEDYIGQDISEFSGIAVLHDDGSYSKVPIGNVKEQIKKFKWTYGTNCRIVVMR